MTSPKSVDRSANHQVVGSVEDSRPVGNGETEVEKLKRLEATRVTAKKLIEVGATWGISEDQCRLIASEITSWIDELRADDRREIDELRDVIVFNRDAAAREAKESREAYARQFVELTNMGRRLAKAFTALADEGTPSEKAALTRVKKKLAALATEQIGEVS